MYKNWLLITLMAGFGLLIVFQKKKELKGVGNVLAERTSRANDSR
ncbi:MAG: energy-converting hydrogenase Eha subunit G [Rhodothermales bacterium]|jgi:energy-converting hydrogenase Eha subunit G